LKREYSVLVEVLEPVISVKAKEEIAAVLVAVFHCFNMAQEFLTDILVAEINRLGMFSGGFVVKCSCIYVCVGTFVWCCCVHVE
jgi:hypothetical protein